MESGDLGERREGRNVWEEGRKECLGGGKDGLFGRSERKENMFGRREGMDVWEEGRKACLGLGKQGCLRG